LGRPLNSSTDCAGVFHRTAKVAAAVYIGLASDLVYPLAAGSSTRASAPRRSLSFVVTLVVVFVIPLMRQSLAQRAPPLLLARRANGGIIFLLICGSVPASAELAAAGPPSPSGPLDQGIT
jgi:hypothetical protein